MNKISNIFMINNIPQLLLMWSISGAASAEHIPLYCKDYILLTKTAVQHRDLKISKADAKLYLAEDEFLNNKEKNQVRQMIERVYKAPSKKLDYFIIMAKDECERTMSK